MLKLSLIFKQRSFKKLAQEAFELGKKLGIIETESLEEFVIPEELDKINKHAERVKKINPQYKNIREDQLGYKIIDIAEKKNKAFSVDWKWWPELIIYGVKKVLPNLKINYISEEFIDKDKAYLTTLEVNGRKQQIKTALTSPYELIDFVNDFLSKMQKKVKFIEYDTGGDSMGFLLLDKSLTRLAENNPFIRVINS